MKFSKMVASGNDFIVIDNRKPHLASRISEFAKKICDRRTGIGADGLLLLEKSGRADFKMRIFNPDGTEPDMCGNGSRCIALYAAENRLTPSSMSIETKAGLLSASVKGNLIKINMTEPKDIKLGIDLELDKKTYQVHYINTGVPHAVYFSEGLEKIDISGIGRGIRYHKAFKPQGVNVDFVYAGNKKSISLRTYERGVEAETLACGTGAVASALISSILKEFKSPLRVHARGGGLNVYFKQRDKRFTGIFLEGEAQEVFTGEVKVG